MAPWFRRASQVGLGPRGAGPAAAQQRCGVPLRGHRRAAGRASDAAGAGGTRRLGRGNHGKMMGKWGENGHMGNFRRKPWKMMGKWTCYGKFQEKTMENDGKMDILWEISGENHGKWGENRHFMGNFRRKPWKFHEKPWKMMGTPWNIMGKRRDIYGCMGRNMRPGTFKRDIYEMCMGKLWDTCGRCLEENHGNVWENHWHLWEMYGTFMGNVLYIRMGCSWEMHGTFTGHSWTFTLW